MGNMIISTVENAKDRSLVNGQLIPLEVFTIITDESFAIIKYYQKDGEEYPKLAIGTELYYSFSRKEIDDYYTPKVVFKGVVTSNVYYSEANTMDYVIVQIKAIE